MVTPRLGRVLERDGAVYRVATEDGYRVCQEALVSDGLLLGHSAGAALWAAREVARALASGVVVALLPDGGERYLGSAPQK